MSYFKFTNKIINEEKINLYNKGNHFRSFTYIDDIIESIYRLTEIDSLKLKKYLLLNIGGEDSIQLMDYIRLIEKSLSKKAKYEFLPRCYAEMENTSADTEKQFDLIGYRPKTNIKDCINKFIASISILENTNITIKQNQRLRFHIGTSEVIGRVSICDKNSINSGDSSACLIKLEKATIVAFQDDFLIRTYSPMRTIGGGIVEDISCLGKWKDIKEYSREAQLQME